MMDPLDLVKLTGLMGLSSGSPDVVIGLLDGPVATGHPDLAGGNVRGIPGKPNGVCARAADFACVHGTFVAGVLSARRGSSAPAICPGCTLLVRPIFMEAGAAGGGRAVPSASPGELAEAIVECVGAGARVLNLSAALAEPSSSRFRDLEDALDHAARRGVILVAAAGNQGAVGSTVITRHPWVIPVIGYDGRGRPMNLSNMGMSVGRRGLGAPGDGVTSLSAAGPPLGSVGTSIAAPFVTGTVALLWSLFPGASAAEVKSAVTGPPGAAQRNTIVPPLLDAWAAYQSMARARR
jgi:subtilisin family serine protease